MPLTSVDGSPKSGATTRKVEWGRRLRACETDQSQQCSRRFREPSNARGPWPPARGFRWPRTSVGELDSRWGKLGSGSSLGHSPSLRSQWSVHLRTCPEKTRDGWCLGADGGWPLIVIDASLPGAGPAVVSCSRQRGCRRRAWIWTGAVSGCSVVAWATRWAARSWTLVFVVWLCRRSTSKAASASIP